MLRTVICQAVTAVTRLALTLTIRCRNSCEYYEHTMIEALLGLASPAEGPRGRGGAVHPSATRSRLTALRPFRPYPGVTLS